MDTADENEIIKRYLKNFLNIPENDKPEAVLPKATKETPKDTRSTPDKSTNFPGDNNTESTDIFKLDSIKSCESVFKIIHFEPGTFNQDNEKCMQFWKLIEDRPDLHPVNCIIMDAHHNQREATCQTEERESEASLWARALYELRKKGLHKVALATRTTDCKFCDGIPTYPCSGYSKSELVDHEDLTLLNDWVPKQKSAGQGKQNQETSKAKFEAINPSDESKRANKQGGIICGDCMTKAIKPSIEMQSCENNMQKNDVPSDIFTEIVKKAVDTVEDIGIMDWDNKQQKTKGQSDVIESTHQELNDEADETSDQNEEKQNGYTNGNTLELTSSQQDDSQVLKIPLEKTEARNDWEQKEVDKGEKSPSHDNTKTVVSVQKQDASTPVQNIGSLLNLSDAKMTPKVKTAQKDEERKSPPAMRIRSSLLNQRKEPKTRSANHRIKFVDSTPSQLSQEKFNDLRCPCAKELKHFTHAKCSCEDGVCKIGKKPIDIEAIEELLAGVATHESTTGGAAMRCFDRIYAEITDVKEGVLGFEEAAKRILDVLDRLDFCDVEEGLDCALHSRTAANETEFIDGEDFEKALLEKRAEQIQSKLKDRIGKENVTSVATQVGESAPVTVEKILAKDFGVCALCGIVNCRCKEIN